MDEVSNNGIIEDNENLDNASDADYTCSVLSLENVENSLTYIIGLQSIQIGLFVGFVCAFAFARLFKK